MTVNEFLKIDIAAAMARRILKRNGFDSPRRIHNSVAPRVVAALDAAYEMIEIYESMAKGKEPTK